MRISVAIPHYNSVETLRKLLGQLEPEGFDKVIVLDDNPSDRTIEGLVEVFPWVEFVLAKENKGAGGNRNRVLEYISDGLVWFVDSDMELVTNGNREKIEKIYENEQDKVVGALILNMSGEAMGWNYGHFMHPVQDVDFYCLVQRLEGGVESAKEELVRRGWDYAWIEALKKLPEKRKVDWCAEGSIIFPIALLKSLGGFDERFLYHEIQDLCWRMGEKVEFDPSIAVKHISLESRRDTAKQAELDARYLFYKEHWGMTKGVFDRLFEEEMREK
jgi:GT2 family glycosyltransferase